MMRKKNWIFVFFLIFIINPAYAAPCDTNEIHRYCRELYPQALSQSEQFNFCTSSKITGCQQDAQFLAVYLIIIGIIVMAVIIIGAILINKKRQNKR